MPRRNSSRGCKPRLFHGRISADADGDTTFDFTILLDRGSAAPGRHTGDEVAEAGLIWPRDFKLDSVRAVLTVDDDTVAISLSDLMLALTRLASRSAIAFWTYARRSCTACSRT